MKSKLIILLAAVLMPLAAMATNGESVFKQRPNDPQALYFSHAEIGAKAGDDVSDALQDMIYRVTREQAFGIIFVGPGTYTISKTIYIPRAVRLIGYGAKRPEIVLAAGSPGFQQERPGDKGKANYMFWFTSGMVSNPQQVPDASPSTFYSCMSNINLRIGKGNPWAVALRTHYAQHSYISHMDVHAENGRAGLFEVGNEMENVRFYGGDWGIYTTKASPGWPMMVVDVYFEGQRKAAIRSQEGGMAIVRMTAKNVPCVVDIDENYADKLFIEDSVFDGVSGPAMVISNVGNAANQIALRNVVCRGVGTLAVARTGEAMARLEGSGRGIYRVKNFTHGLQMDALNAKPEMRTDLDAEPLAKMPAAFAKDVPAIPDMSTWVSVRDFGAVGDGETDDTEAFRKAIAAQKNIYLPQGWYVVSETIELKPHTNLIALHPFATQLILKESTPAFSGFGGPKALLETPKEGTNIVTGLGLNTGAYNYRAVGCKWQSGEKSYMNDVKFVGGHGGMTRPRPEAERTGGSRAPQQPRISSPDSPLAAPGKDYAWDTQYWSLWVTNGGGGVFKNVWTASSYAISGLYVSDTSTPGKIYAMSLEHHVRNEARFKNVSNWKAYAFQLEEESREGQYCQPIELENCSNVLFANLYMFQVIRVNTPYPYAIRTWGCQDVEFLNTHNFAQTKYVAAETLYDVNTGIAVRPWELNRLYVTGKEKRVEDLRDNVGRPERLATGFEFAQGLSSDSNGNIYFCEQRLRRVYKWSPETQQVTMVADFQWEPLATAVDTEDNLLVVFRYTPQPGYIVNGAPEVPATYPDTRGTSFSGYGNNGYTTLVYTIDPKRPEETIKLLERKKMSEVGVVKKALYPSNRWRDFHDFNTVVNFVPEECFVAPDGVTIIPNQYDLARALSSLEAVPGKPFYTSDEYDKRMVRLDVATNGTLSNMKYFVETGETGSAVDASGNLYVADGQIYIFNPAGERIGEIIVPERPLTLAFSKTDHGMLYITSHNSLWRVRVPLNTNHPAEAGRRGFWAHKMELAQMDSDEAPERVILFAADNGHYPEFDIFKQYYAVVDDATGQVQHLSDVVLSTKRDIVLEEAGAVKKLVMEHFEDGKFEVDEKGENLKTKWARKVIELAEPEKVVLGYVTSWTEPLPDPNLLTHANYAFGHVSDTFDGVRVSNPERLHKLVALKEQNPDFKVLISIGGWGSGRFSEMAASEEFRRSFAKDARRVVDEFGLDGIDIDWEYPTSDAAGISSSPNDTKNFTLLMRDLREAIGPDKLLTLASAANANYVDFRAINPYVDFVNIMAYDMDQTGHRHHSALYRSERSSNITTHEAVEAHLAAGVPTHKLVMGVPFYGRAIREIRGFTNYRVLAELEGYEKRWDDVAKGPYLVNEEGEMVAGYDDPRSLEIKTKYINDRGLRGVMYWDFAGDTDDLALSRAIYYGLYPQEKQ